MITIDARTLIEHDPRDLWDNLRGDFEVVFEDGERRILTATEALYSIPGFEFHRKFDRLPILLRHTVTPHIKGGIGNNTHSRQAECIIEDLWRIYASELRSQDQYLDFIDKIGYVGYGAAQLLYNTLVKYTKRYITGFTIFDYAEISNHPAIRKVCDEAPPTQEGAKEVYRIATEVITGDPSLDHNELARAFRQGSVKRAQLLQSVTWRGFMTDIDGTVFPYPIRRGFVDGLSLLGDYIIESRSHAVASANADRPLKSVEYLNRRQALVAAGSTRNLHWGDCGTKRTLRWLVDANHLNELVGIHYYDDDERDTALKTIGIGDKHLDGKYVRMRSPFGMCAHPDPVGICTTCFGNLARNVVRNTNIGHWCSVSLLNRITQMVLSTKHFIGSSRAETIDLNEEALKIFLTRKEENFVYLKPFTDNIAQMRFIITTEQAPNLSDVFTIDLGKITNTWDEKDGKEEGDDDEYIDVHDLNVTRISKFELTREAEKKKRAGTQHLKVELVYVSGEIEERYVCISQLRRDASMSVDFLEYVQKYGYTVNNQNEYVIDMNSWPMGRPVFTYPSRHFSMVEHQRGIEAFVEKEGDDGPVDWDGMLREFFDLVNSKTPAHLSTLAVVLLGNMAADPSKMDFRIPKAWDRGQKISISTAMGSRSLGAACVYQGHATQFTDPAALDHMLPTRLPSPMDEVFVPREYAQENAHLYNAPKDFFIPAYQLEY